MSQTLINSNQVTVKSRAVPKSVKPISEENGRDAWVLKFRESFRKGTIPKYYSPHFHVASTILMLSAACVYSLYNLNNVRPFEWLTIPVALVYGNIGVFLIHRFLHRRYAIFEYPYTIHTKYHHRFFTDTMIEYEKFRDFYMVLFPTQVVGSFTFLYVPATGYLLSYIFPMNVVYFYAFTLSLYFLMYETVHFISHLRSTAPVFKIPLFRYLKEHHRLHHRPALMKDHNFNVVYPLADRIFGTMYTEDNKEKTGA